MVCKTHASSVHQITPLEYNCNLQVSQPTATLSTDEIKEKEMVSVTDECKEEVEVSPVEESKQEMVSPPGPHHHSPTTPLQGAPVLLSTTRRGAHHSVSDPGRLGGATSFHTKRSLAPWRSSAPQVSQKATFGCSAGYFQDWMYAICCLLHLLEARHEAKASKVAVNACLAQQCFLLPLIPCPKLKSITNASLLQKAP